MTSNLEKKADSGHNDDQQKKEKQIMVLGVGNLLLMDEGFGVHVIQELEKKRDELKIPPNVELMDGGTSGLDLAHYVDGKDKLIVVDVINAEVEPGTLFRFKPDDIETQQVKKLSLHQITLYDAMSIAEKTETMPKDVIIIAVQPKDINNWSMELSEELKAKIPKVIELVIEEIEKA